MGLFSRLARPLSYALLLMGLAGCTVNRPLFEPADGAPVAPVNPHAISDAVPRVEPVTRAGNKNPYTVAGKTYHLLPTSRGYRAEGIASWYGTKFHGRNTANGERYSLYGMTAAHKTLPIPAYVKVTNLDNGRTVVVRVNDRGPFHDDRLIDLSYAAAVKLGYAEQGTARVRIEAIDVKSTGDQSTGIAESGAVAPAPTAVASPAEKEAYFLQVGAFKSIDLANRLRAELILSTNQTVKVAASEPAGLYRVQVGPLETLSKVQALSELLIESGLGQPRLLSN